MKRAADAEAAAQKVQDELRGALADTNARLEAMDQQRVALAIEVTQRETGAKATETRTSLEKRLYALEQEKKERAEQKAKEMDTAGTALEERDKTIAGIITRMSELSQAQGAILQQSQNMVAGALAPIAEGAQAAVQAALVPLPGVYARVSAIEEEIPKKVQTILDEDFQKRLDTISEMMQRLQEGWVKETVAPAEKKLLAESASLAAKSDALTIEYTNAAEQVKSASEQAAIASSSALKAETALAEYQSTIGTEVNYLRAGVEELLSRLQRVGGRGGFRFVESSRDDVRPGSPTTAGGKRRAIQPTTPERDMVPIVFSGDSMDNEQ